MVAEVFIGMWSPGLPGWDSSYGRNSPHSSQQLGPTRSAEAGTHTPLTPPSAVHPSGPRNPSCHHATHLCCTRAPAAASSRARRSPCCRRGRARRASCTCCSSCRAGAGTGGLTLVWVPGSPRRTIGTTAESVLYRLCFLQGVAGTVVVRGCPCKGHRRAVRGTTAPAARTPNAAA